MSAHDHTQASKLWGRPEMTVLTRDDGNAERVLAACKKYQRDLSPTHAYGVCGGRSCVPCDQYGLS